MSFLLRTLSRSARHVFGAIQISALRTLVSGSYTAAGGTGHLGRDANVKTSSVLKALLQLTVSCVRAMPESVGDSTGFLRQVGDIATVCKALANADAKNRFLPEDTAERIARALHGGQAQAPFSNEALQTMCRPWCVCVCVCVCVLICVS